MRRWHLCGLAFGCFLLGALAQSVVAQSRKPSFSAALFEGKDAKTAAAALLDGALQLAGNGSWERIAVGRAWYLGGDKARGQQIFDGVTAGRKVEGSDWFRIARVYAEANEWDQAQKAFDRAKAEILFEKALTKNPREFWHWVGAGASYLGVRPQ